MKCTICGSENLEGAAFCEDCGARLPMATGMPATSAPPVQAAAPPAPVMPPAAAPAAPAAGGTVKCPGCGALNPANESFCEDCGASLKAGEPAAIVPEPVQAAPPVAPPPAVPASRLDLPMSGKTFPVDKDAITLGRRSPADGIYPDVDLTDDDPESYISRRHGQLSRKSDGFYYEDLGSSNGSFVNGTRVNKGVETLLKDGDMLRLGKTELVFRA